MAGLRLAFAFLLLTSAIGVVICGVDVLRTPDAPRRRTVMILGGDGPYWQTVAAGARAHAALEGVALEIVAPATVAEQVALIDRFQRDAVDALAVSPISPAAGQEFMDRLAGRVKLVTFAAEVPRTRQLMHLGIGDVGAGRCAAEAAVESLPDGGRIIVLAPAAIDDPLDQRLIAFKWALRQCERAVTAPAAGWSIALVSINDPSEEGQVAVQVGRALSGRSEPACVVDLHGGPVGPLARALDACDETGQVRLIAVDECERTIADDARRRVFATVTPDPYSMGQATAEWITTLSRSDKLGMPIAGKGGANLAACRFRWQDVRQFSLSDRIARRSLGL